jgi:hypothetical protein
MTWARSLLLLWPFVLAACAFDPPVPGNVRCNTTADCLPFDAVCNYDPHWVTKVCCRNPFCPAIDGSAADSGGDIDGAPADASTDEAPVDGALADASSDVGGTCQPRDPCPPRLAMCGGPTCAVVLSSDQNNCSACGRSCHGSECQDSECQPIVLARDLQFQNRRTVFVNEEGVFWATSDGTVTRLPFEPGAAPIPVATGQGQIDGIVADGDFVYLLIWAGRCGSAECLRRVPLVPGRFPETNLTDVGGQPGEIAIDPDAVYWFDSTGGGSILRLAKADASVRPQIIAMGQGFPRGLALDETHVYWTTQTGTEGLVKRARKDGTSLAPEHLAAGLQDPIGVALNSHYVYWADAQLGVVQATPKEGGGKVVTLAAGQTSPVTVAADEVNVYWGFSGGIGDMWKVQLCGGEPRVAVRGNTIGGMMVWKGDVYWNGNDSSSGVFRVAQ